MLIPAAKMPYIRMVLTLRVMNVNYNITEEKSHRIIVAFYLLHLNFTIAISRRYWYTIIVSCS